MAIEILRPRLLGNKSEAKQPSAEAGYPVHIEQDSPARPEYYLTADDLRGPGEKTDGKVLTAQLRFSAGLLRTFMNSAKDEMETLQRRSLYQPETGGVPMSRADILIDRVTGLSDAYKIYADERAGIDVTERIQEFMAERPNYDELLQKVASLQPQISLERTRAASMYDSDSPIAQKVIRYAKNSSIRQRLSRMRAKNSVRSGLGDELMDTLYDPTDTTRKEEKEKTQKWAKTLAIAGLTEGSTMVLAHYSAKYNIPAEVLEYLRADNVSGKVLATTLTHAVLWSMLYGPQTERNANLLEDKGISTSPAAKVGYDLAAEYQTGKDPKKLAKIWNRAYEFSWEAWYAGLATYYGVVEGSKSGVEAGFNEGTDFAIGGATVGVVRNAITIPTLYLLEQRRRRKNANNKRELTEEEMYGPDSHDMAVVEVPIYNKITE